MALVTTARPPFAQTGPRKAPSPRRLSSADREMIGQIEPTLELLHGKWKVYLVFLMARGIHRHCRLLESLPGASKKMMTDTLRALEHDGLVTREIYPEVPLRVEYSLTPLGWATTDLLMTIAEWHEAHGEDVRKARRGYRVECVEREDERHHPELRRRLTAV
jgi:DNA-binding HxlR family transcriptional regulator